MNKVHKLNLKLLKPNRGEKKCFYSCDSCDRIYHQDLMISYLPSSYAYYKDTTKYFCIRCYNKKF